MEGYEGFFCVYTSSTSDRSAQVRGVYVGSWGLFSEGSTTGVTDVKKRRGMNFKIIVWNGCYGNELQCISGLKGYFSKILRKENWELEVSTG